MDYLAQGFNQIQSDAGLRFMLTNEPSFLIEQSIPYIFGAAGIILLLNIVSSGLKMMTSQGDPKALQGAQSKLTTSLIGILILFTSFWVVNLIMRFFGINFGGGTIIQ